MTIHVSATKGKTILGSPSANLDIYENPPMVDKTIKDFMIIGHSSSYIDTYARPIVMSKRA